MFAAFLRRRALSTASRHLAACRHPHGAAVGRLAAKSPAAAGVDPDAPRIARLLDLVEQVRGLPRHLGQHSGGVVIAAGRLDEVVPIEPASMVDRRVVQWDKDDCADLGIIKIDLLGLGMLETLEETIAPVRPAEGADPGSGAAPGPPPSP